MLKGLCPFCKRELPVKRFASNRPFASAYCVWCGLKMEFRNEDVLSSMLRDFLKAKEGTEEPVVTPSQPSTLKTEKAPEKKADAEDLMWPYRRK